MEKLLSCFRCQVFLVSRDTEKKLKVDQVGYQLRQKFCCEINELNGSILADRISVEKFSCFVTIFSTNIGEQSLLNEQVKSIPLTELIPV